MDQNEIKYRGLAIAVTLMVLAPTTMPNPLFIPGSAGGMKETQLDRFRKGFSTVNDDHVDQFDSNTNIASFDRENTAGAATNTANIAAGATPFNAGAGSAGSSTKALTSEFDRGALINSNSRFVNQNGRQAASALDSGVVQGTAASEALIGGPVAGAGSSYQTLVQGRERAMADADHVDQQLAEESLISDQFDRGMVSKDAAAAATIGESIGAPFGAAIGSDGMKAAEFAESRTRGINAAKKSVLADRNANVLNEAYGKEVSARTGANDVILVGPAGASAGRAVAAQHLAAAQGALQHTDEEESRAVNAANLKALDKTWVSGSQEQHVGIANGALVGEISS